LKRNPRHPESLKHVKPKQLKQLLKIVQQKEGWTVIQRKSGHIKVIAPNGQITFCSSTARRARTVDDILGDLRRIGWEQS